MKKSGSGVGSQFFKDVAESIANYVVENNFDRDVRLLDKAQTINIIMKENGYEHGDGHVDLCSECYISFLISKNETHQCGSEECEEQYCCRTEVCKNQFNCFSCENFICTQCNSEYRCSELGCKHAMCGEYCVNVCEYCRKIYCHNHLIETESGRILCYYCNDSGPRYKKIK